MGKPVTTSDICVIIKNLFVVNKCLWQISLRDFWDSSLLIVEIEGYMGPKRKELAEI